MAKQFLNFAKVAKSGHTDLSTHALPSCSNGLTKYSEDHRNISKQNAVNIRVSNPTTDTAM